MHNIIYTRALFIGAIRVARNKNNSFNLKSDNMVFVTDVGNCFCSFQHSHHYHCDGITDTVSASVLASLDWIYLFAFHDKTIPIWKITLDVLETMYSKRTHISSNFCI